MKTKINLTLDEYEARLLDKAVRLACRFRGDGDEPDASNRRFLLRWMIVAICSAIIRRGEMPAMLAVDLRDETKTETRQRLAGKMPHGPEVNQLLSQPCNPWN